jgi:TonB family protein
MTRRWWGGPGISVVLHGVLLLVLIYAAAQPSRIAATGAVASKRTKFIYTVMPGLPGAGGGGEATAAAPRTGRPRDGRPLDLRAPATIRSVEPPAAFVPAIAAQDVEMLPGAPLPVDGMTVGKGSGPGTGGGRGPGSGAEDGGGLGDVYDSGVGGVSAPALIHEVRPAFTVDAIRAKTQGVVVMDVVVLADGSVDPDRIRITRSLDRGLDQQAILAVRQWRFRPSLRLGHPVASRVTVELAFTLR